MQEIPSLSDFPILEQVDPKSKLRKAPWYDLNISRSFDFIIDEYYFENFYSKLVKLFEANSIPLIRKL